jgi:nucleoside-diphosphate kinase
MALEKTLVFLKPDTLSTSELTCTVIERIVNAGFRVLRTKLTKITDTQILSHYDHLIQSNGDSMRQKILSYFSGKQIFVMHLEKEDAIQSMRTLIGATDPVKAGKGTIRGDLSSDSLQVAMSEGRFVNNLIHASDSTESATRETKIWLT